MCLEDEGRQGTIKRRVLAYVVDRPAASDTIEGIRLWWLREESEVPHLALSAALAELVAKNWLTARPLGRESGEQASVYGLNATEVTAVRGYLAQTAGTSNAAESRPEDEDAGRTGSAPGAGAARDGSDG